MPGWVEGEGERPPEIKPFLWRWSQVEPLVLKSGTYRRSGPLMCSAAPCASPLRVWPVARPRLCIPPSNCCCRARPLPAHRHTPTAIRWILKGKGAYTTVNGDKCWMEPGDLVLTPSWTWHDHSNEGNEPMIWMDGLDIPLVRYLKANFYEQFPEDVQPIEGTGTSARKYAAGALRPTWEDPQVPYSSLWHYKWNRTYDALSGMAEMPCDPHDDVAMEYRDPVTGGPVLRTMACWVQMIRPGVHTKAHRHTSSKVYQVFQGSGHSVIDGQRFGLERGRLFRPALMGLARARLRRRPRSDPLLHPGHPCDEGPLPLPRGTLHRARRPPAGNQPLRPSVGRSGSYNPIPTGPSRASCTGPAP